MSFSKDIDKTKRISDLLVSISSARCHILTQLMEDPETGQTDCQEQSAVCWVALMEGREMEAWCVLAVPVANSQNYTLNLVEVTV